MLNVKAALEDRFPDFFEKHTKIGPILLKFLDFFFMKRVFNSLSANTRMLGV